MKLTITSDARQNTTSNPKYPCEMDFGFSHPTGCKHSWICWTIIFSMMSLWTSVDCWSYHYSNKTMNWQQARSWCQESYTDMVAIQNQEEIAHLNALLPKKDTYYWIGIRKVYNIWTWVGTNKALTPEAVNWAIGEPNNGKTGKRSAENEDCVEMYIKRDEQAGKWNDERCTKPKTALCYTAACKDDSCLHGDCVETINSLRCECYKGFYGDKCEHVVECNKEDVAAPHKGGVKCVHKHGNYTFDSTCHFSCEDGYKLSTPRPLQCTESQTWSAERPTCNLVQCPQLLGPLNGSMSSTDPLGPDSYKSTRSFTCHEGFELVGAAALRCEESGRWNESAPICAAVKCPTLRKLENGVIDCDVEGDVQLSFGNTCDFSCSRGYKLVGPSGVRCTSEAEWSQKMPSCEAVTCTALEEQNHLITRCSHPLDHLRPNSTCSFSCEDGYELKGAETTECSEDGLWTEAKPACQAVKCPALPRLENGVIDCDVEGDVQLSFGNTCGFSCSRGYKLVGPSGVRCTSEAEWSEKMPSCEAVTCTALEEQNHLITRCSHPLDHLRPNSICSFSCEDGYELKGAETTECSEDGLWTEAKPACQAVKCPALPRLENGVIDCDVEGDVQLSFGNTCGFSCSRGYKLVGPSGVRCTSEAEWSEKMPSCEAVTCTALEEQNHLITRCSHPLDHLRPNSICSFSCEDGYELKGAETTECSEAGLWTEAKPACQAVKCPALEAPDKGHINCSSSEQDFNTRCTFTCDQDHLLDGHELLICDRHGNWTGAKPACQAAAPQAAVVASSVAAASALSLSAFSLAVWILRRLKKGATKFELNSNSDMEDPHQVYKNSIDSLI